MGRMGRLVAVWGGNLHSEVTCGIWNLHSIQHLQLFQLHAVPAMIGTRRGLSRKEPGCSVVGEHMFHGPAPKKQRFSWHTCSRTWEIAKRLLQQLHTCLCSACASSWIIISRLLGSEINSVGSIQSWCPKYTKVELPSLDSRQKLGCLKSSGTRIAMTFYSTASLRGP